MNRLLELLRRSRASATLAADDDRSRPSPPGAAAEIETIGSVVDSLHAAELTDREALSCLALEAAVTDVEDALDPECPSPTPGEQRVRADAAPRAGAAQRRAAEIGHRVRGRMDAIDHEKDASGRGEPVTDGAARRRVVAGGLLLVSVVGLIEKETLQGPLATALQQVQGSFENQAVASLMAFGAAGVAAIAGEAWVASLDSLGGLSRSSAARRRLMRRVAWAALLPLVVVATWASVARITTLEVAASFSGVSVTTGERLGVVLVQVFFVLVALAIGLGTALLSRFAEQRAEDNHLRACAVELDGLARFEGELTALGEAHVGAVRTARDSALTDYRAALVSGFAKCNPEAAVRWEQRFAGVTAADDRSQPAEAPEGPTIDIRDDLYSGEPDVIDLRLDDDDDGDDLFAAVTGPAA